MSTQVRALAMLLAYSFSSSSGATENFWPPATPSPSPKPKIIAKPRVEKTPWFEEDTKDSEATLLNAILGFDVILKNTAGPQAQSVRLNRVQLILRLARYRILKKSDEKSKGGLDLVQTALADCQQILNAPGTSPSTRGRTLYLKGLAQTYLNHPDDAVATFKEALSILPKYGMAGWAAFFVIDETFEEGKFADAIAFHDLYESLWNPTLRRLARYKKAWAHLNIGQPAKAAGLMIELIRENGNDPIGVDCLKDLASQHASSLTEAQILANAGEIFKEPSKRSTYLRAVQANLAATDRLGRGSPVLAVVLNDERDPAQRVLVFMGAFSQARKEFASREHFHTFEDLLVKMTAWKVTPQSPGFDKIAGLLDWELRLLSKAYLETYSGRVESPEVLGKEELATSLEKVFSTYYAFFPASRVVAPLVSAWLDVCIEQKHWNCVAQVGKLTLEAPNLKALSPRGETERIAALDALYNASPTTPTLREELLRACADFSEHNPASPHWLKITKRWVTLKIEAGQTQEALPLLEKLFVHEGTPDNFERLQRARFQLGHYPEILSDTRLPPPAQGKSQEALQEIVREASLKTAVTARGKGDSQAYVAGIRKFLLQAPSPEKARLARADLVAYFFEHGDPEATTHELLQMPRAERLNPSNAKPLERLVLDTLRAGKFERVLLLLAGSDPRTKPAGLSPLLDNSLWLSLSASEKPEAVERALTWATGADLAYLKALLAITRPDVLLKTLERQPPQTENERILALTSLRLVNRAWYFEPTPVQARWLGDLTVRDLKIYPPTPLENELRQIRLPITPGHPNRASRANKESKRYLAQVQDVVTKVRMARSNLTQSLKTQPHEVQARLLQLSREKEQEVAQMISDSPIPAGLAPDQVAEYQQGLTQAAQEFSTQATRLAELQREADRLTKAAKSVETNSTKPTPNLTHWHWGLPLEKAEGTVVRDLLKVGNFTGALIVADLLRADVLKDDEAYYATRAGILLTSNESETMRQFVVQELNAAHQEGILKSWPQ